jgi:hypothetical protein
MISMGGEWLIVCAMWSWELLNMQIKGSIFFPLVVMRSQISITKARFQSMVMWLKTREGCPYS